MRTLGAVEFAEAFPGDVAGLAERFGVSRGTISAWRSGARKPVDAKRQTVCDAGGPLPSKWDEPVPQPPAPPALVVVAGSATPEGTVSVADEHLAYCRALQAELMTPGAMLATKDKVSLAEKLSSMIVNLGKLTGAGIVNQRQIVESPYFALLLADLMQALVPWPEALRAVAAVCNAKRGGV